MSHEAPTTEQSHTSHWLEEKLNLDLIRCLCEQYSDSLRESQLGTERGSSRRSNGRRTLNMELRKALPQVADLELILDPILADEVDTAEGQELRRLLSEVSQFLDGISVRFATDRNERHEDEGLEAILARLRASANHLSEAMSNPDHILTLFAYDSEAVLTRAIKVVKEFNQFLHDLKHPTFDPYDLMDESAKDSRRPSAARDPSTLQTEVLDLEGTVQRCQRCFKHAQTAIKAMFSRLSTCRHRDAMVHRMLVQLPEVEEITSRHNCSDDFILDLFLSDCPKSSQWQEARITRISQFETPDSDMSICEAIREALDLDGGLHFHVKELNDIDDNNLIVPWYDYLKPQHDQMKPTKSIWDLLEAGYLGWAISARRLRSSANMKAPLIKPSERRSLAIQMVFGIVLCLRYDSNLATWDSRRVYLLAPADGPQNLKVPPYVSCVERHAEATYLDLPNPDAILQETDRSLSYTFTKMAKALLEIGLGECLDEHDADSNGNSQQLRKHLWELVQNFNRYGLRHTDGVDSLDKLPYFAAAERCLRFTLLYRKEVNQRNMSFKSEDVNPWAIVEKIVSQDIISELEKDRADPVMRRMDTIRQPRSRIAVSPAAGNHRKVYQSASERIVGVVNPQKRIVKLFDNGTGTSEDHKLVSRANAFFSRAGHFHQSFRSFVENDKDKVQLNHPIRVAILDTGINKSYDGIQFDGKHMKDEWCVSFVGSSHDTHDHDGHGTMCASLVWKIAPDAEVYILKVFSGNEFNLEQARNIPKVRRMFSLSMWTRFHYQTGLPTHPKLPRINAIDKNKAIRHAVKSWDVDVISMSFGLQLPSSEAYMPEWTKIKSHIANEIDSAKRTLFFAAASNEGKNEPRAFPSTHPSVFCVHASDGNGNDCGINPHHDDAKNNIMVLGTGIELFDEERDGYVYKEGTSFATAIAAGLTACILDLTWRVPTKKLCEKSKEKLRTYEGMRFLFDQMSEPEPWSLCRFTVPWKLWDTGCWEANPYSLDLIWLQLNRKFIEGYDHIEVYDHADTKKRRIG